MFDSGCTSAVLLSRVSESVNIITRTHLCQLSTFDEDKCEEREFASFELLSMDRSVKVKVRNALVGDLLTTEKEYPPRNNDITPFKYLSGVVFNELPSNLVGIVLGAPYAWMWMTGETKFHSPTLPLACKSKLGWILVGPCLRGGVEESPMPVKVGAMNT